MEWLIVRPLRGITNFYYSANFTNYESSKTDFFSGSGKNTFLAAIPKDRMRRRVNTVPKRSICFKLFFKHDIIIQDYRKNIILLKVNLSHSALYYPHDLL